MIPAPLRKQAVYQVTGRIRGNRFRLAFAASGENGPDIAVRGVVVRCDGTGARILATIGHGPGSFAVPAVFAALAIWNLLTGSS